MEKIRGKFSGRLIAAFLAVLIMLSMIPFPAIRALAATEQHPDAVTITVIDENKKILQGATVEYEVKSDEDSGENETLPKSETDEYGCVEVLKSDEFVDGMTLSATVIFEGYTYADENQKITDEIIENGDQDFTIKMKSTTIKDVTISPNLDLVYTGAPQSLMTISGTQSGDIVIFKIDDDKAVQYEVGKDQKVEAQKTDAKEYAIAVTIQRAGYTDKVEKFNVTIAKADIDIVITGKNVPYNEAKQDLVEKSGNFAEGDRVEWFVNGEEKNVKSGKVPQEMAVGTYSVRLVVTRGDNYNVLDKTVNAKIQLADLDLGKLSISANELTYDGTDQKALTVENQGDYTLQYNFDGTENWAEFTDKTDYPTVKDAGNYTIYVRAIKDGYNNAQYQIYPISVTVAKSKQNLKFNNYTGEGSNIELTGEIPYAQTYDFSAKDEANLAGGTIFYDVELSEEEIAEIDADTGLLKVYYPGVIQINATLTGNENYNDCIISYVLTVAGVVSDPGQYIGFDKSNITYILGTSDTITDQQAVLKDEKVEGTIAYTVDNIPEGVSHNDGVLVVTDYDLLANEMRRANGQVDVTITATKAATSFYGEDTAACVVTVKFADAPIDPYTINAPDGTNDWYITFPTVTPAVGYTIAKTSNPVDFESTVTLDDQGDATHYVSLRDSSTGGITDFLPIEVKIDTVEPDVNKMSIEISELNVVQKIGKSFGFYNPSVDIEISIEDETADDESGVGSVKWNYTKESDATSSILPSKTGELNVSLEDGKYVATLTLTASEVEQYRGNISFTVTDIAGNTSAEKFDDGTIIVVDTITPFMRAEHERVDQIDGIYNPVDNRHYYNGDVKFAFAIKEANFFSEDVAIKVTKDEANYETEVEWSDDSDDDEVHYGTFTLSGDGDYIVYMTYSDLSGNKVPDYESEIITIDTIDPQVSLVFDQDEQKTTITVEEHNFRPVDIVATVVVKDRNNNAITANDLTEELKTAEWTQEGDAYTYVTDDYVNGIYDIALDYMDLAGHTDTYVADEFIIDHDKPTDPVITYSTSLMDTILGVITLGFYNPNVTITYTSYDSFSGVDYFTWSYMSQADVSETNVAAYTDQPLTATADRTDLSKFSASITLPSDKAAQLRGYISVTATDVYKNTSNKTTDNGIIIVVDTVSPTMTVGYSAESNKVGSTLYYGSDKKGRAEMTLNVTEANFFAEDVVVKVSKNGGTFATVKPTWTNISADRHTGKFILSGDGNYVVSVEYTDRSKNRMSSYISNTIIIDTVKPVIQVDYHNKNVIDTLTDMEGNRRNYFDKTQSAVISITEHNFNANDVNFNIVGKDVTGAARNVNSLISRSAWSTNGDVHKITISYLGDANYTFDVDYTDFAQNKANDYAADYFTVDTAAPAVGNVTYSASILDTILSSISFGFYNTNMTVTITATDDTAGIHKFDYSYLTAAGVSSVNTQLVDQAVEEAGITYSNGDRTAILSFEIPRSALGDGNQFNGTVEFDIIDRSKNRVKQSENKRLVVDSIAPTATVAYNEPVNKADGISYYDDNIEGTITITEANFFPEDVVVMVSANGGAAQTLPTTWSDSSVNVHDGTFTLTDDADYVVTITYKDKSGNTMADYTSSQMTLDTEIEEPSYTINGEAQSGDNGGAYKNDTSVEFSFGDQNFDTNTISLIRTRYDKVEDVTDEFIDTIMNDNGGSGSFSIPEKVEYDGIYLLTIGMTDKAEHRTESYVRFIVNRFGSVYAYSDYLSSLIQNGGQYVNLHGDEAITEDLIITEYNADELVDGSLKLLITRDGEPVNAVFTSELVDSTDWFEYVYTISKSNFKEDGVYKLTISSEDATGNVSTSVPENSIDENGNTIRDIMTFTVDTVAPEILNVVNLEHAIADRSAIIDGKLNVKYSLFDVGGLAKVEVLVNNETLNIVEEFDNTNSYSGAIDINESNDVQTVRLVITDFAGNVTDTASEEFDPGELYVFNDRITVSTNTFVRWYRNVPLFWGSIAGIGVLVAGCVFLVVRRKKAK